MSFPSWYNKLIPNNNGNSYGKNYKVLTFILYLLCDVIVLDVPMSVKS